MMGDSDLYGSRENICKASESATVWFLVTTFLVSEDRLLI